MDFHIWFAVAIVLLAAVHADPTKKPPQTSAEGNPKHKRQQRYEMKEVILYLTPTQIRALEAGQGLVSAHPSHQPELPTETQHQAVEAQNAQQLEHHQQLEHQQQLEHHNAQAEADRKHRLQLQEAVQYHHAKKPIHEHKVQEQIPQEVSNLQNYPQYAQQPEFQYNREPPLEHNVGVPLRKPDNYAYLYFYPNGRPQNGQHHHIERHNNQAIEHFLPQQDNSRANHLQQQFQLVPYTYSSSKPDSHQLPEVTIPHQQPEAIPQAQPLVAPEALPQPEHLVTQQFSETLPSGNAPPAKAFPEALQFLAHQLNIGQLQELEFQKLPTHQMEFPNLEEHLKAHLAQLEAENFGSEIESEQQKAFQANLEAQQFGGQLQVEQNAQQAHFETQQINNQQHLPEQHKANDIHAQFEAQQLEGQLQADQQKAHQAHLETQQLEGKLKTEQHKSLQTHFEIQQLEGQLHAKQHKANELKAQLEAQQKLEEQQMEVIKMDAHHESQQVVAEVQKAYDLKAKLESQQLNSEQHLNAHLATREFKPSQVNIRPKQAQLFEPNFGQMDTLLSPLVQHHGIEETLSQTERFKQNPLQLEGGFRPLKTFEPKEYDEKYVKEIEKIIKSIRLEKQEALAKAVAISISPPVVVHEDIKVTKRPVEVIKHVNVPMPIFVPVPKPFEVKVPQPYPVPIEIINHVPYPIIRTEKVEVEKPVPFEVEKHIPVPVTKNVYVQVDKPYFIEKRVPVVIHKKIPVKIPIIKPQKFTIVRHVWNH